MLWVDIPTDSKNAGVQKQVSDGLQAIVKKYLPSEVPMEMVEIGAEGNQAWVDFLNSAMNRMSVEDFVKLGAAIVKEGSDVIMDAFGGVEAPTESCNRMQKKESLTNEDSQKDPEWNKYLHDVKMFIGKHYIKNIVEWVRKRGNTIKDEEGNQFINMVASCYDEDMRVAKAAKLLSDWVTTNDHQHTEWDAGPKSPLERQIMLFDNPAESKKNEKSYLLDADDRKILDRNFYSDADMDLLERNFGMLKFVDSFFPDDKTNGTATKTEISAEDAETMVGDHESFLVLCMDTLANKDGFDYQVYRVYGPEGTDYITCSYK